MKKTALGLTLALTMSAVIACTPADDEARQGYNYDQGYRGANYQQYGTQDNVRGYGQNRYDNFGTYGNDGRYRPYAAPGLQGQMDRQIGTQQDRGTGLFGNERQGNQRGIFNRQGRSFFNQQNQGMTNGRRGGQTRTDWYGTDQNGQVQNRTDRSARYGAQTDDGIRGGGANLGGTGNRMEASRDRYEHGGGPFGVGRADSNDQNDQNQALAQRISQGCQTIDGVRDAHVVVHYDDILVGVEAEDGQDKDQLEAKVRSAVEKRVNGKQVHVSSDQDMVDQLGDMEQNIFEGRPITGLADDIGEMIENFGRAVQNR